jgi:hypothetical protein
MRWMSLISRMADKRVLVRKDVLSWHDWFAWHPIRINRTSIWLETVERRSDGWNAYNSEHIWKYRLKELRL